MAILSGLPENLWLFFFICFHLLVPGSPHATLFFRRLVILSCAVWGSGLGADRAGGDCDDPISSCTQLYLRGAVGRALRRGRARRWKRRHRHGPHVLPPGATDNSQAVAYQTLVAADKGLGFTAAATGDFTARVVSAEGSGPVTLTATAVGTAEHRSLPLRADGRPHPLEVSCIMNRCTFDYDGATVYDGDGSGFDLVRDC
eukprot:COSAG06_NODE_462_length_15394_cov_16.361164_2_plen_201_part_00